MSRFVTIVALCLIAVCTLAQTQEPYFLQSLRVTADFRNAPLSDALDDLLRDSDVLFVFAEEQVNSLQTTAHLIDVPLGDALDALLGVHGMTYGVVGGNIIVIGRPGTLRVSGPWGGSTAAPPAATATAVTPVRLIDRTLYVDQQWTIGDLQITLIDVSENDPNVTRDETATAILDTPTTSTEVTLRGWADEVLENYRIGLNGADVETGMALISVAIYPVD